jgi:hypothetical protein
LIQNEPAKANFETAVTEAIDDILSTLGNANKQTIYRLLKDRYDITQEEIPVKTEAFAKAIEQIFGSAGKVIEVKIIERLHSKYKDFYYVQAKGELILVEFISSLQHYLESQT